MKAIDKWLQPDLPEDQDDRLTEKFITRQVEEIYKQALHEKLESEYGISKNSPSTLSARTYRLTGWKAWVSVAAAVMICVIGLKLFLPSADPAEMAIHYLEKQTFFHSGTTKGVVNEPQIREQIQLSFNEKRYGQVVELIAQIEQPTTEDMYYHALALMLGSKPADAIPLFEALTTSDSQYAESAKWYYAISLMLTHQTHKALEILMTIKPEEWNYAIAQKYIRKLN